MIKGKLVGITFGGLAGYLLIGKAFHMVRDTVAYVTDASKWKAYYKYGIGKEKGVNCVVPPGYSSCTREIGNGKELVVEDPKQKNTENGENGSASKEDLKASISSAIKDSVDVWLRGKKAAEGASEGHTEASEEDIRREMDEVSKLITDMTLKGADIDEIEHAVKYSMDVIDSRRNEIDLAKSRLDNGIDELEIRYQSEDGIVTETDENGKPVAGRYPFGDTDGDDITAEEDSEDSAEVKEEEDNN